MPCCSAHSLDVFEAIDTPVDLDVLAGVIRRSEREGLALALHLPAAAGGTACAGELLDVLGAAEEAWVVQRPGCSGLVTRVVLRDARGRTLAALAAARAPYAPEPTAWRVLLLLGILASEAEARPERNAAK